MSITQKLWIGVVVSVIFAAAWILWPHRNNQELRKQIGEGVLDDAVDKAKGAVALDPQREQSFRERFWERFSRLFQ